MLDIDVLARIYIKFNSKMKYQYKEENHDTQNRSRIELKWLKLHIIFHIWYEMLQKQSVVYPLYILPIYTTNTKKKILACTNEKLC